MAPSSALAAGLLALVSSAPGGPGTLEHLAPATLQPHGAHVRAPDSSLGFAWARHGATLALVAKPVATGQPIRIVDVRTLRTRRVLPIGDRDVCGLTFDGRDLVALTANQPCYWAKGRFALVRYDSDSWRVRQTVAVPGLRSVFLTNLDDFQAMNDVYAKHVGEQPPARATVEVAKLPSGALVEIEAIARI